MTVDHAARRRPVMRGLGGLRAVAGGVLLARPAAATRWVAGTGRPVIPAAVARALGARLAVQAAVELARPTRRVARLSAAVDAMHALSMLIPAGLDRRYRRAAAVNAVTATATAALLALESRRTTDR
jgi:hypothetical protein